MRVARTARTSLRACGYGELLGPVCTCEGGRLSHVGARLGLRYLLMHRGTDWFSLARRLVRCADDCITCANIIQQDGL